MFAAAALAAAMQPSASAAATLAVLPVRVEVAPAKQFCSLTISNEGTAPVAVQVRGYAWRQQADGADVLEDMPGIAINPPIASIPAGGKQLVRCSLPPQAGPVESTYRLIVNELPDASVPPGTVQTLLQLSIPVFRAPAASRAVLHWSADAGGRIVITNAGQRHSRIVRLSVRRPGMEPLVIERGFYLLAGSRRSVDLGVSAGDITGIEATTADGAQLPLDRLPQ